MALWVVAARSQPAENQGKTPENLTPGRPLYMDAVLGPIPRGFRCRFPGDLRVEAGKRRSQLARFRKARNQESQTADAHPAIPNSLANTRTTPNRDVSEQAGVGGWSGQARRSRNQSPRTDLDIESQVSTSRRRPPLHGRSATTFSWSVLELPSFTVSTPSPCTTNGFADRQANCPCRVS